MADMIFGSPTGQWVCPNDRQLALRAKLQTGWSVHTFQTEKQRKTQALSPKELEVILEVIRKAEQLDIIEQQRIGRLVERLENMRKNAMGNGLSQCLLCGELLGLLGSTAVFCQDCRKEDDRNSKMEKTINFCGVSGASVLSVQHELGPDLPLDYTDQNSWVFIHAVMPLAQKVCTKCGIETVGAQKRPLWLCKICSEQREVWKRSGAWFYKGLPKYIRPLKSSSKPMELHPRPWQSEPAVPEPESVGTSRSFTWARGKVVSSDSESDSELSSSSLDDKPIPAGSKGSQGRKLQAGLVPSREPSQALGRALGSTHSLALSGSHSSLGSEQGAELSATESCHSDQPAYGRDSDAATRVPDGEAKPKRPRKSQ